MTEYVGGGESSPLEVFDRFAAVPASLYKPVAPSVSETHTCTHENQQTDSDPNTTEIVPHLHSLNY